MTKLTRRDIFGVGILAFLLVFSLLSWRLFFEVATRPDIGNTLSVAAWLTLLLATYFLGMVVWRRASLAWIGVGITLVPSLFFAPNWYHLLFVFFAGVFLFESVRMTQQEMIDRLSFHFFRTVRTGSFSCLFALSLTFTSVYYSTIERESWEELVPRFSMGEGTTTALFQVAVYLNPDWKNLADDGTTVDDFLLSLQKQKEEGSERGVPPLSNDVLPALIAYLTENRDGLGEDLSEQLALAAGRAQIATLVGRPVSGDEKIANVFSVAIQNKIITLLRGGEMTRHASPTIVPVILSVLLFLTLLPLGSLLALPALLVGFLVFRGALWLKVLAIENIPREQKTLVP